MTDFLIYQGKAAIALAVFYMFYRLLLSKETFHRFNRIVLLGTAALSFVLPPLRHHPQEGCGPPHHAFNCGRNCRRNNRDCRHGSRSFPADLADNPLLHLCLRSIIRTYESHCLDHRHQEKHQQRKQADS